MKNNTFSQSQIQAMVDILQNDCFGYQATWLRVGKLNTDRSITTARQIGATWLFSREALLNALITGDDQIYFAHTVQHAHVAATYMNALSARVGIRLELSGNMLQLDNGARISFVGEKSHCAALSGNVYLDSFAWFREPIRAAKLAKAIACHKHHSLTMFTAPSDSYAAFRVWSGAANKRRPLPLINTGDSVFCKDGIWRQSVTLDAACERGFSLFSPSEIKDEYSDEEYRLLFGCDWSFAASKGTVSA